MSDGKAPSEGVKVLTHPQRAAEQPKPFKGTATPLSCSAAPSQSKYGQTIAAAGTVMFLDCIEPLGVLKHHAEEMRLAENLGELPKPTEQERETIRNALDLQKEEDRAMDEGFRSVEQEPPIPWPEVERQIQQKHGWA